MSEQDATDLAIHYRRHDCRHDIGVHHLPAVRMTPVPFKPGNIVTVDLPGHASHGRKGKIVGIRKMKHGRKDLGTGIYVEIIKARAKIGLWLCPHQLRRA